jgi:hypothetical protein
MVTVTTMQPSVGFVMPDAAQLKSLRKIVAAACSWIGGISEQSAEADLEFRNAIWGVGRFWRTELPDERRSFGSLLDDANEMLIAKGYASVGGPMFLAACLAAGDVVYRRGDPSVGQLLSIGLNSFQGMRANNRWVSILSGTGNVLAPMSARAEFVARAGKGHPQPSFWTKGENGMRQLDANEPLWSRR